MASSGDADAAQELQLLQPGGAPRSDAAAPRASLGARTAAVAAISAVLLVAALAGGSAMLAAGPAGGAVEGSLRGEVVSLSAYHTGEDLPPYRANLSTYPSCERCGKHGEDCRCDWVQCCASCQNKQGPCYDACRRMIPEAPDGFCLNGNGYSPCRFNQKGRCP